MANKTPRSKPVPHGRIPGVMTDAYIERPSVCFYHFSEASGDVYGDIGKATRFMLCGWTLTTRLRHSSRLAVADFARTLVWGEDCSYRLRRAHETPEPLWQNNDCRRLPVLRTST